MSKIIIEYGSKEYETMIERTIGGKAKEPFKIEEFCAELAWMGKHCPVYPFALDEIAGGPCKYLTSEKYEGYRCPVTNPPENFVPVIAGEGTEEQKRALEHLADMYLRYGQRRDLLPNDCGDLFHLFYIIGQLFDDAEEIYNQLGLEEKARDCAEKFEIMKSEVSTDSIVFV